jgi:hypothetical protein
VLRGRYPHSGRCRGADCCRETVTFVRHPACREIRVEVRKGGFAPADLRRERVHLPHELLVRRFRRHLERGQLAPRREHVDGIHERKAHGARGVRVDGQREQEVDVLAPPRVEPELCSSRTVRPHGDLDDARSGEVVDAGLSEDRAAIGCLLVVGRDRIRLRPPRVVETDGDDRHRHDDHDHGDGGGQEADPAPTLLSSSGLRS